MTTYTFAQRFEQKRSDLRDIAVSLGRADIFDRDLAGGARIGQGAVSQDEAIKDAIDGVGWYLQEEHEYDGEQGYAMDPRTAKYAAIVRYIRTGTK